MNKLDIGKYIERFVDWLSDTAAPLFRQITIMIDNSVDVLQELLDRKSTRLNSSH